MKEAQREVAAAAAAATATTTTSDGKKKPVIRQPPAAGSNRRDLLVFKWQYRKVAELIVKSLKLVRAADVAPNDLTLNGGRGTGFAAMGRDLNPELLVLEKLRGLSMVVTAPPDGTTLAALLHKEENEVVSVHVEDDEAHAPAPVVPAAAAAAKRAGAVGASGSVVELSLDEIAKAPLRRVLKDQKGWIDTLDARLLQAKLGLAGYDQFDVFKRMSAPAGSLSASSLLAAAAARDDAASASAKADPYKLSSRTADRVAAQVRLKEKPKAADSSSLSAPPKFGTGAKIAPIGGSPLLKTAGAALVHK
jgi:hypothetical protein